VSLNRGAEAAEEFGHLRRKRPEDPAVLLGLARSLFKQARHEEAEQLLDDLLSRHPDLGPALGERGRSALASGELDRAEAWLRRAADAAPNDGEILYSLVQCLERQGNRGEAEEYSARLRRIDDDLRRMRGLVDQILKAPGSAALRHEIGVIFLRNGFVEDGVRWQQTALDQDPGYRPAHLALAEHYQRTGQLDLAARHRRAAESAVRSP
jgi:tetratricopeptide (TPR) repeat protein